MSLEMWAWWEETLTEAQRETLLALPDARIEPGLALELWRSTGSFRVIEGTPNAAMTDGYEWALAPEVADFVLARGHELRHPEDFR